MPMGKLVYGQPVHGQPAHVQPVHGQTCPTDIVDSWTFVHGHRGHLSWTFAVFIYSPIPLRMSTTIYGVDTQVDMVDRGQKFLP